MERAGKNRSIASLNATSHTYFHTVPGGGSAISRLDRWYVTARYSDWIQDFDCSVPGPAADHNVISVRIETPHHVVRIRKPGRVYPFPGCVKVAAISEIPAENAITQRQVDKTASVPTSDSLTARRLADWWDT